MDFHRRGSAYRHKEEGQLWCFEHASFETVQGQMYVSSPGIITFGAFKAYRQLTEMVAFTPPADGYPGGVINEETRVLFPDKQLLAYICGSDRAVAGGVNRFATFPAVLYDTVKGNKAMNG